MDKREANTRWSSNLRWCDWLKVGRAYTTELYKQKCSAVFEHVYESYPERDAGVYA